MSVQLASLSRATVAVWSHPETEDIAKVADLVRSARARFGLGCAYISVSPVGLVVPTHEFMRQVAAIMDEMLINCAIHAVLVIEGTGLQQTLTRALHTSLFTVSGYARRIAIVSTLPDAFRLLAPLAGVDRAVWHAEAREHPLLEHRVITTPSIRPARARWGL
jgi:hypothetical protein